MNERVNGVIRDAIILHPYHFTFLFLHPMLCYFTLLTGWFRELFTQTARIEMRLEEISAPQLLTHRFPDQGERGPESQHQESLRSLTKEDLVLKCERMTTDEQKWDRMVRAGVDSVLASYVITVNAMLNMAVASFQVNLLRLHCTNDIKNSVATMLLQLAPPSVWRQFSRDGRRQNKQSASALGVLPLFVGEFLSHTRLSAF